jgi:hypothetical protein
MYSETEDPEESFLPNTHTSSTFFCLFSASRAYFYWIDFYRSLRSHGLNNEKIRQRIEVNGKNPFLDGRQEKSE